jgi:mxaJ protein
MKQLRLIAAALAVGLTTTAGAAPDLHSVLRVCADPNNLPFSNQRGEGFENKIAERLARLLGAELQYTWWAQRRGFVRNTLDASTCDVIIGVPLAVESVSHTQPYYRSSYVFVTRAGRAPVRSFDDPVLRRLRIGIPVVGDDGLNPPPESALARRGIVDNVVGFSVYGNYGHPDPPLELLRALVRGDIDVAATWGPPAGYFARKHRLPLTVTPVVPASEIGIPFVYDITIGVRRGPHGEELRRRLDRALRDDRAQITKILDDFGVPRV